MAASLRKVRNQTLYRESRLLQGAELTPAWSASIDCRTGALTAGLADSQGAYVVFGPCKATAAKWRLHQKTDSF